MNSIPKIKLEEVLMPVWGVRKFRARVTPIIDRMQETINDYITRNADTYDVEVVKQMVDKMDEVIWKIRKLKYIYQPASLITIAGLMYGATKGIESIIN